MENEIKEENKIYKEVEINIDIDDVYYIVSNLDIQERWKFIAKIFNNIRVEEIETLSKKQRTIIKKYLKNQISKF